MDHPPKTLSNKSGNPAAAAEKQHQYKNCALWERYMVDWLDTRRAWEGQQ